MIRGAENTQRETSACTMIALERAYAREQRLAAIYPPNDPRLLKAKEETRALLYEQYTAVGAPYGATKGGMEQWARECVLADALEQQAAEIRSRHLRLAFGRALSLVIAFVSIGGPFVHRVMA